MLKKKRFTCSRALLPVLLLGVLAAPAFGQDEARHGYQPIPNEDFRVSVFGGLCFDSEHPVELCKVGMVSLQWYRRRPHDAGHRSFYRPFSWEPSHGGSLPGRWTPRRRQSNATTIALALTIAAANDMWPPPTNGPINTPENTAKADGAAQLESARVDHKTVVGVVDLVLPIPVEPRFLVEPFVGAGMGRISEGNQRGDDYALGNASFPVLSYGVAVTAHLKGRFDVIVQYRAFVFFPNELNYRGPRGLRIASDDVRTVDASSLSVGVGLRF